MHSPTNGRERARAERVERWLAAGGTVLAANERAARQVATAYDRARLAEGREAWRTPAIFTWDAWVRERWLERNGEGLTPLNELQERALWTRAIQGGRPELPFPGRLADAAMRAYRLLCQYAPGMLRPGSRAGWTDDAAVFSGWVEEFESACRREGLVSGSRLGLDLAAGLDRGQAAAERAPLLLVGFDRVLAGQRTLLDGWGAWRLDSPGLDGLDGLDEEREAAGAEFWAAADGAAEVAACVEWLGKRLDANGDARLLVVVAQLEARRGELERALEKAGLDFEFSKGFPLAQTGLARGALLLLRWLGEPLAEPEVDWLIGSGYLASNAGEQAALAAAMREARRRGQERLEWPVPAFAELAGRSGGSVASGSVSSGSGTAGRLRAAQAALAAEPERQSALGWAAASERLLTTLGWPGFRPLGSVAFQARERWRDALAEAGSLGFDGGRMDYAGFVAALAESAAGTLFAAESSDARVQISGPPEAAGQLADGVWFLGADEENWPGRGQPHPLLPIGLARQMGMPHASAEADWTLAEEATGRLLASADEVVFSYARQAGGVEARPSRLILKRVGPARECAPGKPLRRGDRTERFEDRTEVPFPLARMAGGAGTLTRQSRCPFQAFAVARLAAEDWEPAEAGLSARQRGQLLHTAMRRIWGGREGGIRTLAELQAIPELREFVSGAVSRAMEESFDPLRGNSLPERFPQRYLDLEAERLTGLVTEWLEYERTRLPFTVEETEVEREVTVAGLNLTLRLDRLDRLDRLYRLDGLDAPENGGRLVVDYKTGRVGPSAWEGERPEDVQLPVYAAFAVPEALEGLVFARVQPGETQFLGRVRDAGATLLPGLSGGAALARHPLTDEDLRNWRERIERLAGDFLAGRAGVDPREPGKTCRECHLQAVCRIHEREPVAGAADENDPDGAGGQDD